MTTAMMMKINTTLSEVENMLYHDFKNRYLTIADLIKKTYNVEG